MKKEPVVGPGIAQSTAPYTQALRIEAGRLLYISGQIPVDGDGNLVGRRDAEAQTREVFSKIRTICEAADLTLDNVVFINIYVTDIRFREAITRVRNEILNPPYPCASMVQVDSLAHEDWLVEIDAVAALA